MRLLLLLNLLLTLPLCAEFRAAVVEVDITPATPKWLLGYADRQSTGVLDRIHHRVVALDDGQAKFVLVSTDLCMFSPSLYDETARRLQAAARRRATPVLVDHHPHPLRPRNRPPGIYPLLLKGRARHPIDADYHEYTGFVVQSLVTAAQQAISQLAPARLAAGTGMALANINRRSRDPEGRISLGLNPNGPADRQIGLLRLEKADGSLLALIANYAMHATVLGSQFVQISGDAPGIVAAYVEQKLGARCSIWMAPAGDLAPIYSVYPDPRSGHLTQFSVLLGDRILAAQRRLPAASNQVKLAAYEHWIESPRKAGLDWTPELARYQRGKLVRLPVRLLTINDTAIWSAPVELFCEIALTIRRHSPFPHTFYFGYTNGWFGYLPPKPASPKVATGHLRLQRSDRGRSHERPHHIS
jgi:hypothetical protein